MDVNAELNVLLSMGSGPVAGDIKESLSRRGARCSHVCGFEETCSAICSRNFDAVFVNLLNPSVSVSKFIREVRALSPSTKIAVVSSSDCERDIQSTLSSGASVYLIYPFTDADMDTLLQHLSQEPISIVA